MADGATTESDVSGIISVFDRLADSLVAGLLARVAQLRNVGREFDALQASFAAVVPKPRPPWCGDAARLPVRTGHRSGWRPSCRRYR